MNPLLKSLAICGLFITGLILGISLFPLVNRLLMAGIILVSNGLCLLANLIYEFRRRVTQPSAE